MDFDHEVPELDSLRNRVESAQERIFELRAGRRVESDEFISKPFMRDHTQFDSFAGFHRKSPWDGKTPCDINEVRDERLDEYVAQTTEFSSWEEMRTVAAKEEIVDQLLS